LLDILEVRVESLPTRPVDGEQIDPRILGGRARGGVETPRACDVVLMRAVAPLALSLGLIDSIASRGCKLLTYKGPRWRAEVEAAQRAMDQYGWIFVEAREIPWALARILILTRERGPADVPRETF